MVSGCVFLRSQVFRCWQKFGCGYGFYCLLQQSVPDTDNKYEQKQICSSFVFSGFILGQLQALG